MSIASAGNLSISQSVVSILTEGYDNPDTGERETLMNSPTLFQAVQRVGRVVRTIRATEGKVLETSDVTFDVSFLFGGQIIGERMRLLDLFGRQFHRMHRRHALSSDRRTQIRQAGSRPRHQL